MVDFVLKFCTNFCEPDSETLINVIRKPVDCGDSIQKRLGPEGGAPGGECEERSSHEPGFRGRSSLNTRNFWNFFSQIFFAPKFNGIFLAIFFSIFLEYSEINFDLIASQIFTISFMVILWSIF